MTGVFSHEQQLKAFINTAQYLAGLSPGQDIWTEAGKVLVRFFGADVVAFAERHDHGVEIGCRAFSGVGREVRLPEQETTAAVREVFESGFLSFLSPAPGAEIASGFFPIICENSVIAVMLVGHLQSAGLAKETLDLYLAVAGLIGATYTRKVSETAVLQAKEELEQRVAERTSEISAANASLRDSRRAALNLMEDAVIARREAEEASAGLRREIAERKRVEEALRESEERVRRKLDSILTPEGDLGNLDLADVIDSNSLQALVEDFYKLSGMPMGLLDDNGKVLVGVGWQEICTKFHRLHPETCRNCFESDTILTAGIPKGEYKIYRCKNGMWDVATPVIVGDRHLGNLFMGQFLLDDEEPDHDFFRAQASRYGFDEAEYIAALEAVPRLSRPILDTAMDFFMELADILSKLSYSNLKLARSLFERDTLTEELSRSRDELDRRVAARTEELASAINIMKEEVAEREKAEERLLRLNRLYAVLSETNQAIVRAKGQKTLFRDFCRIAVEQGGFLLAWVGLVDRETGLVQMVAAHGATAYLRGGTRISVKKEPEGEGPTGISIRKGTYHICNDFLDAPCTEPWHEKGRAFGIAASASIALKLEGRVLGALTLYAGEKDFFDEEQVELLKQMGSDVSFALDNLERDKRRREAQLALRRETAERLAAVEALNERERLMIQQSRQAAMGEMISNIAHQWRQPLNVMGLLFQELPVMYDAGRFTREYLQGRVEKAKEVISHMSLTIDDFRTFFMPDREKVQFRVREVIEKALSLVNEGFRYQEIGVTFSVEGDPVVEGYPNEFSQVILNILVNARDAFEERMEEHPWRIAIAASGLDGKCLVTIADNAGGIPEEVIGRVFDPYFTTKAPDKGTGVGLFMAKTIIEKNMKGRLSVRNDGQGAEFTIEV